MNSRIILLYVLVLLISFSVQADELPVLTDASTDRGLPTASDADRISYLYSFKVPGDIGFKESITGRMKDIFTGSNNNDMIRPYAVAVNDQVMAVADPGKAAVHLFNVRRKKYEQIVSVEKRPLVSPVGIALAEKRIYIADSAMNTLFVLDAKRRLLKEINDFQRVTGLAYSSQNKRLYVVDTNAHHVLIYDREGTQIGSFGERGNGDGQFNYPSHLAIARDRIYVNDTMNFRVQAFDLDGNHLKTFGIHGDGAGYFDRPKGLGVNSDGHLFVVESVANRVQIFSPEGEFLMSFGNESDMQTALNSPAGLAIFDDKIYVADSGSRSIKVFQYQGER